MSANEKRTEDDLLSPRVRELAACAIRVAVRRVLDTELSEQEALELAAIGLPSKVVSLLEEKLRFPRVAPGLSLPRESQVRIAVLEIVADAKGLHIGDPTARIKFLREAITSEQQHVIAERELKDQARLAETIAKEVRNQSPDLRAFVRKVDRIRVRQINRLQTSILDQDRCNAAINKLDRLVEEYVRRALRFTGGHDSSRTDGIGGHSV